MSVSSAFNAHLPELRRFARALSGSQAAGDRCVEQLLEDVLAGTAKFSSYDDPKVGLYSDFVKIWSTRSSGVSDDTAGVGEAAYARQLNAMTPRARQAFLLRHVEGFSVFEVGQILNASEPETQALIERAGREMAQQVATDVLIIEDEPLIALDLKDILLHLGHRVIGIARTRAEAARLLARARPGLVLADVRLADESSGLDAVNDMLSSRIEVPVIFVTAYPERLLTGRKPEPVFLVTKPYRTDALKATICQALFFDQRSRAAPATA